jgi:hypothetical protein
MSQQSTGLSHAEKRGGGRNRASGGSARGGRVPRPPPGSWEDRSIAGFCLRHNWSRSTFENNRKRKTGPRETRTIAGGRVTITEAAEVEFDEKFSS